MPQVPPSSAVTEHRADGVVTVAVRGELDPPTASQARERIASVIGSRPQRLTLNLVNVSDRSGAQCLALIAVTQHLIPAGCTLEACTSSPAVLDILALAGWSGPDPAARPCQGPGHETSECSILGVPREFVRCAGPVRSGGADSFQ